MSINYAETNKRAVELILSVKKHVSSIDDSLRALIEIRVSQINGCAYCVDLHSNEARELGVPQQRLDCLPVWQESGLFGDREMAALAWAESVTHISIEPDIEGQLHRLLEHFSEAEAVDLTIVVSLMNSLNRMAKSFGDKPAER